MMKACFLSAGGDVLIASLVLKLWKERWYDEVDKMYICYNNHAGVPVEIASEFVANAVKDPKVELIYHPKGIGNGAPITEMTLISKEDLVMLLEDDGMAFTSGEVESAFKQIENGHVDAVGSPRGSCGQEITDAMCKKYNLDISGVGDRGVNYWPNFFFCRRDDLLKTDMNFGSKEFTNGLYYKELDHTMSETQYGDTFVWADIQMRYNGVRFGHIPQYHASPTEPQDKRVRVMNWTTARGPLWIHGGSLSTGWGGYLSGQTPDVSTDMSKQEIETRVAWWQICSDVVEGFDSFKEEYRKGIEGLVQRANLDQSRIKEKYNLYRNLIKL